MSRYRLTPAWPECEQPRPIAAALASWHDRCDLGQPPLWHAQEHDFRPDQAQKITPAGKVLVLAKGGGDNLVYEDEVAVYVKAPRNQRVLPKRPS